MKKRTAFLGLILSLNSIIFFTKNVKSEEYICSAELSAFGRPGEVETGKYERIGNYFPNFDGEIFISTTNKKNNNNQIAKSSPKIKKRKADTLNKPALTPSS